MTRLGMKRGAMVPLTDEILERHLLGETNKAIADAVGCSEANVSSTIRRARIPVSHFVVLPEAEKTYLDQQAATVGVPVHVMARAFLLDAIRDEMEKAT